MNEISSFQIQKMNIKVLTLTTIWR